RPHGSRTTPRVPPRPCSGWPLETLCHQDTAGGTGPAPRCLVSSGAPFPEKTHLVVFRLALHALGPVKGQIIEFYLYKSPVIGAVDHLYNNSIGRCTETRSICSAQISPPHTQNPGRLTTHRTICCSLPLRMAHNQRSA